MPSYSPELIQTMRAALDEVMTKIPLDQATPAIKALVRTLDTRTCGNLARRCLAAATAAEVRAALREAGAAG